MPPTHLPTHPSTQPPNHPPPWQPAASGQYAPLPEGYSPELQALVAALLQQSPGARPNTDEILLLPFVRPHLALYARHITK